MYAAKIIEQGSADDIFLKSAHPYTIGLMRSVPRLDEPRGTRLETIEGLPPDLLAPPAGCRFAPRCPDAQAACREEPALQGRQAAGRLVACHFPAAADLVPPTPAPRDSGAEDGPPLLAIDALEVTYERPGLFRRPGASRAVDGVSLTLRPGEILGLVGESGSGKSTILRCVAGLWPALAGRMRYGASQPLAAPAASRDRSVLRAIQLVFQNPDASLNPRQTVREILAQPLRLYFGLGRREMAARLGDLLRDVRLDDSYLDRYPAQLSGGERQRVAIARAYAAEPDIVLLDEVTSALDVSVQASILQLIRDLSVTRGTACVLVSHDLAVVQALADRIAVLYRGRLVEIGPARRLCRSPAHPYTQALIGAVLEPEPAPARRPAAAARERDDRESAGCPYAGRCALRLERCFEAMPDWQTIEGDQRARCFRLEAQAGAAR
jgi:peptide/nickel transport system ATP-binding protein